MSENLFQRSKRVEKLSLPAKYLKSFYLFVYFVIKVVKIFVNFVARKRFTHTFLVLSVKYTLEHVNALFVEISNQTAF